MCAGVKMWTACVPLQVGRVFLHTNLWLEFYFLLMSAYWCTFSYAKYLPTCGPLTVGVRNPCRTWYIFKWGRNCAYDCFIHRTVLSNLMLSVRFPLYELQVWCLRIGYANEKYLPLNFCKSLGQGRVSSCLIVWIIYKLMCLLCSVMSLVRIGLATKWWFSTLYFSQIILSFLCCDRIKLIIHL